jgi:tyrosine-protein kinase Etk/Wzc
MEEQVILEKQQQRAGAAGMNVKELFFKYVRFLPLYIIFVSLALIGAYIYLRYATEVYRSMGQIVIRDESTYSSRNDDKIDALMQSDGRKNVQTEIEVLQSRPVMSRVVEALNLNFNYFAKGRFKQMNMYKISPFRIEVLRLADSAHSFALNLFFPDQKSFTVNGSKERYAFGQVFKNAYGEFRMVRANEGDINPECTVIWNPTLAQAGALLGGLAIAPKQNTGILTITMEATSPVLAADVINRLVEEYKEITIEDKNEVTRKSLRFIDANLRDRERELDSIKQIYVAYQKSANIIDPETQSHNYFSRVEDALRQEQDQRVQLNIATQLQDYLRGQGTSQNIVPSSLGITDPLLNGLVADYNRAQLERKTLLENAPPGNVVVQQKTGEVEALRGKILENVKNIRQAYSTAIGTVKSTGSQAVSQIKTLPNKKQELVNIQQQLESKAQIYNTLLAKREESAIALASTISNTKVLLEAAPDIQPVKPNRRSTQLLAVLIGLVIPTIIIIILELLNDKVNSKADVEKLTDAAILGEVGHSVGDKTLIVTAGNRKFIAEQFRILRSNLQYILPNTEKPVVLVTSSFSGEGKSFISTNMGAVLALAAKKTIILEFDIRKPKVISGLGLPKQKGLTNFILGQAKLEELPVQVPGYDNLFVLPCGPIPPNPAELLLDPKLTTLFDYLRQNFDMVVMDTAPVGMVSDAMTLSKFADCTLYIVRQGHTYKKQINLIEEYSTQGKLPKISIVLNDVKIKGGYGNYGYGGYGYGYGYGAGYFEEDTPEPSGLSKWFGWLGAKNGTQTKKPKKKKV